MGRLSLLALLIAISFIQCRLNHESPDNLITVSGKITGVEEPFILVYMTGHQQGKIKCENHSFLLNIQDNNPTMISFTYGFQKWDVFAQPGDSIHMEFDHFDFANFGKSLAYSGDRILENQTLLDLKNAVHYGDLLDNRFYIEPEAAFVEKIKDLSKNSEAILNQRIFREDDLGPFFKDWASAYVRYAIDLHFEEYYRNKQSASKDITSIRALKTSVSGSMVDTENSIHADKELLAVTPYRTYLTRSLYNDLREQAILNASLGLLFNWTAEGLKLVEKKVNDPELKEGIQFTLLRAHFANYGTNEIETEIADFLSHAKDEKYINAIHTAMKEWEGLAKNALAPSFSFPDVNGMVHSLDNFKGKYLYVDVWATWCGPCLRERPHFEDLIARYEENPNIVFLGISTDKDTKMWKKMVTEKQFKGIQLLAGQDAAFHKDYKIKLIPHFMLIDPEGNLIEYQAPRPSSENIGEILDGLVKP